MKRLCSYVGVIVCSVFMFTGFVNALQCNYSMDFSKFGCGGSNVYFYITYQDGSNPGISDFSKMNSTQAVCNNIVGVPSNNVKRAKNYYEKNGKCPQVYFEQDGIGNFYLNVIDDGVVVPDVGVQYATNTGSSGGEEAKVENICNFSSQMRNESWDVTFKFYKVNGQNKWSVSSSTSGTPSENNANGLVSVGNHSFSMDSAVMNSIYNSGKCPTTTYLKCNAAGGDESVLLTTTQPSESENCAYGIFGPKTSKNSKTKTTGDAKYQGDDRTVGANFCDEEEAIKALKAVGYLLFIAKIMVPLIIVGIGTWDLVKAVQDPDKALSKQARGLAIRIAIGILIFFIPRIVYVALDGAEKLGVASSKSANCRKALLDPWNMGLDIGEIKKTD